MKLKKTKTSDKIDGAVNDAIDYEITVADLARKSARRAWMVTWASLLMSLILAGGYYYMLPLKEKVPYLIMADAYTGTSSVTQLRNSASYQTVTASEVVNRSNIASFILARESFDVSAIGTRDWRMLHTMSSREVSQEYTNHHSRRNPASPINLYGRTRAIRINILSITPSGRSAGGAATGATVRFQRTLFNKTDGTAQPLDNKIATMAFEYKPNLSMSEEDRLLNPLGFQVTDYRVDTDFSVQPPPEVRINAAPPTVPDVGAPMQAQPQGAPGDVQTQPTDGANQQAVPAQRTQQAANGPNTIQNGGNVP